MTQGSSFLATLGFESESLWDSTWLRSHRLLHPGSGGRVAHSCSIPTGLRLAAQGCEERATLGKAHHRDTTPTGLRPGLRRQEFNPAHISRPIRFGVFSATHAYCFTEPRWLA